MIFYYGLLYLAVLSAAMGQIFLKIGSSAKGAKGINVFGLRLNLWVLMGVCAMIMSILLSVRGMSMVPLRDMAFILPSVYFLVPVFSRIFLKERLGHRTIIGTLILIIGVILFNIPIVRLF